MTRGRNSTTPGAPHPHPRPQTHHKLISTGRTTHY
ncbi:hypothetical protein GA0115260_101505 [Streptomyces sp. MnatMP-M27]|nr:hypothetical protein GA0115260_101505 [Streptomyces sp. MnatMP-M27]